jgi:hypothetical protein
MVSAVRDGLFQKKKKGRPKGCTMADVSAAGCKVILTRAGLTAGGLDRILCRRSKFLTCP